MRNLLKYIIFILLFFSINCKKDKISHDKKYPNLPAYTEKGLNTGGVLINNKAWVTVRPGGFSTAKPLRIISFPKGDSILLILTGKYKDKNLDFQEPHQIFVVLKGIKIESDSDLIKLNNKSYNLDGKNNYGGFMYSYTDKIGKAIGDIQFGKAEIINNITIGNGSPNNPKLHPYILSGKFSMTLSEPKTYTLTHGRFDATLIRGSSFGIVK